jgi:hypothetical protein
MGKLSGPMFEPAEHGFWRSIFRKQGAHYNIYGISENQYKIDDAEEKFGMAALKEFFPDAKANEYNLCLFSTSGVHGMYNTIEEAEEHIKNPIEDETCGYVTFLIIQPRIVCLRYGNCYPKTDDDFQFLKKLRQSSWDEFIKIGKNESK